ncbi:uncharacterized protein LOC130671928 [Microplitis mediator]|uniref:uncharacterized protein LOC130671928 n=1 Tax=Microplitis mediator TaxID=375433 RepID=UPI002556E892|nr:uncharacterized protein LOC130671928 [Microplitis mediator]
MASALFSNLTKTIIQAYNEFTKPSATVSEHDILRCQNMLRDNIILFNNLLSNVNSTVSERQSLQHNIGVSYAYIDKLAQLGSVVVGGNLAAKSLVQWQDLENAFNNRIKTGCILNQGHTDVRTFLMDSKNTLFDKIKNIILQEGNIKVSLNLSCLFENVKGGGDKIEEIKSFKTQSSEILSTTDLHSWFTDNVYEVLLRKIDDFNQKDSGWSLIEVMNLVVNISRYAPLEVGMAKVRGISTYVRLPQDIQEKKAVLNIENFDAYCFLWAVTAVLYPARTSHPERTQSYPQFSDSELKYAGIKFPIVLKDIAKYESLNNLAINVYGIDPQTVIKNGKSYQNSFDKHKLDCIKFNKIRMELPTKEGKILKFKNYKYKDIVPFVVYADLECTLLPESANNDNGSQTHIPHSIAMYTHCSYEETLCKFEINRSPDCIEWFTRKLENLAHKVNSFLWGGIAMKPLNSEEIRYHNSMNICHICSKVILANEKKCHDHCHFTGKYRGPAHNSYSFRFMASSIEKLASYLTNDDKQITRKYYTDPDKFKLMIRKGVFPCEYIDSVDKLDDKQLPEKQLFYSKLNDNDVSDEDYNHAQEVWNKFNIKTLGEYSDLYLKTDVLLLADIFENFRHSCQKTYELDPLHYFTSPGLSLDAMLKMTNIELELLTDAEMILFIEKGIRGEVSQCTNRYAQANNRFMGDDFDQNKDESYLMYFDVNNLYGGAMSMSLPQSSFKWKENITLDNINTLFNANRSEGYILEVDLDYPIILHELHKDLPLCPEHFVPPNCKQAKLATTLYSKKNYVVHYKNLQQYLTLSMKLVKVHRVLKFKQSAWLKSYIDKNTECRKNARNEFEKNFYKLMNNAVFGKTMENVRKYKDVKLVTKWHGRYGAKSLISKPNFHSFTIFDKELLLIELKRVRANFNKPIYVGFTILDLSKTYIYDFHYNYIKKQFTNDESKLMYTDTDSLIYYFKVPNIYEIIKRDIKMFDTSDYPPNNIYDIPLVNKKVVGLMKDENNGEIMSEFVGLRAKLYAFRTHKNMKAKKRAKRVKGSTLRTITFNDFKNCLEKHTNVIKPQFLIRSNKHEVKTIKQTKLALSWNDDKRKLQENSPDTLPWGYKKLKN